MKDSGFIERSLEGFARVLAHALESDDLARVDGFLQPLDPRVKTIGLFALIAAAVASRRISVILAIAGIGLLLAVLSHVPLWTLAARVWLGVLLFTGCIAVPAVFITPGQVEYRLPLLGGHITETGVRSAIFLIARAETTATLALLLVVCTPWTHLLKALRALRVPIVLVVIVSTTSRYIFLLLETAREMFESRRSRTVGRLHGHEQRALMAATAGVLLDKTFQVSNEVYLAMQSRGFTGEVYLVSDFHLNRRDGVMLAIFLALTGAALWLGR